MQTDSYTRCNYYCRAERTSKESNQSIKDSEATTLKWV